MILLWKKLVMHAFSFLIRTHLESWNIIKPTSGEGVAQCKDNQLVRCTNRIETTTEWLCMPILKNNTRKQIKDSPRSFFNLMRAHNLARKDSKKMLRAGKLRLTRESLGRIHGILLTTCDKQSDSIWNYNVQSQRHYFNSSFEDSQVYSGLPSWIKDMIPISEDDRVTAIQSSPITPVLIKGI